MSCDNNLDDGSPATLTSASILTAAELRARLGQCCPCEVRALKLALPSYSTVYQAELCKYICKTTREILKTKAATVGIYSDSMAALQIVTNVHSLHPLTVETRANLKTATLQNKLLSLFWTKPAQDWKGMSEQTVSPKKPL